MTWAEEGEEGLHQASCGWLSTCLKDHGQHGRSLEMRMESWLRLIASLFLVEDAATGEATTLREDMILAEYVSCNKWIMNSDCYEVIEVTLLLFYMGTTLISVEILFYESGFYTPTHGCWCVYTVDYSLSHVWVCLYRWLFFEIHVRRGRLKKALSPFLSEFQCQTTGDKITQIHTCK
jgi:hypothetical protein